MSFTFSTIPLDCLALSCQYLSVVHDLIAIHSTSRHWRHLLIHSDKYSHSLLSCGYSVNIKWRGEDAKLSSSDSSSSSSEQNELHDRQQQRDLLILPGLQLAFRHLRVLTINFESSVGSGTRAHTKKMIKRANRYRNDLYTLIGSLTSIEHLSLSDSIICFDSTDEDDTIGRLDINLLSTSLAHIMTLRSFHYNVVIVLKGYGGPPTIIKVAISDTLVMALMRSTQLRAIGGDALIQSLNVDQWITIFSSLSNIECVASINRDVFDKFEMIRAQSMATSHMNDIRVLTALHRIRAVQQFPDYLDLSMFVTFGCTALRTLHTRSLHMSQDSYSHGNGPANRARDLGALGQLTHLRALSLNINRVNIDDVFVSMAKSLVHLQQLELNDIYLQANARDIEHLNNSNEDLYPLAGPAAASDGGSGGGGGGGGGGGVSSLIITDDLSTSYPSLVSLTRMLHALISLRCLILASSNITTHTLGAMLRSSPHLLELRLYDSTVHDLNAQILHTMMKSHTKLHLLHMRDNEIYLLSGLKHRLQLKDVRAASPKRCAKMLDYAKRISWLDLMIYDRATINQLLNSNVRREPFEEEPDHDIFALFRRKQSPYLTRCHSAMFDGIGWRHSWIFQQDLAMLEQKTNEKAHLQDKSKSDEQ